MSALKPIACPSCGASKFQHDSEGNIICSHCGVKFSSPREQIMCPTCGVLNSPDANRCMNCGAALGQACPVCHQFNPPGTVNCLNCASPLDTLARISTRYGPGKRESDAIREEKMLSSRGDDMVFMQRERERIAAEERARMAELAAQRSEARRQQQTLMIATAVALMVLLGGAALVLFLVNAR